MDYRVVDKDAFTVVGRRARVPVVHVGRNNAIEEFARGVGPDVRERLAALSDQEPHGVLSVTDGLDDRRAEGSEADYWVAAVTSREVPADLDALEVPGGSWLVLTSERGPYPENLQDLWRSAYGEWFPANPWRTRPGPELLRADLHEDGTAVGELWLPVEAETG